MAKYIRGNYIAKSTVIFTLLFSINHISASIEKNFNTDNISHLGRVNFLAGISELAVGSGTESECVRDLDTFLKGLKNGQVWAVKILDSFGVMPQSFNWGNNFWFASSDLCYELNNPFTISLSSAIPRAMHEDIMNATSPFPVEFRMVYFNFTSPMQVDLKLQHRPIIHVGLCIPRSCKKGEIVEYTNNYFGQQTFELQRMFKIQMTYIGSKVPQFKWTYFLNTGVILMVLLGSILIGLAILAGLITVLRKRRYQLEKASSDTTSKFTSKISFYEKLIMCFSLRDNIKTVFRIETPKNFLSVIAGIRTIVCLWVVLFHVFYHSLFAIKNVPLLFAKLESLTLQPVLQSCFYVDVFFVLSAFLLVYNFLSNTKQMETIRTNDTLANVKLFFRYFAHRHLRLMPIFILTMMLSELFYAFLDMFSPFMLNENSDLYCRDTWWYNLLYINNFISPRFMCSSWGWYLACDMQFYVFFLLILFIYAKREIFGSALYLSSLVAFLITSFYCNFSNGITFQGDIMYNTMEYLYIKPYVRINPYFGGALMGWILYRIKSDEIYLKKHFVMSYWSASFLIYLVTIFMSYWKGTPIWLVSTIMSLGKLLFGIFIGSIIVMCQLGYGGIFTNAMGAKIFLYLNKFSFSMYMVAPLVITNIFGLRAEATNYAEVSALSDMVSVICITFVGSMLAVLCVELPFNRLSNNFILKRT